MIYFLCVWVVAWACLANTPIKNIGHGGDLYRTWHRPDAAVSQQGLSRVLRAPSAEAHGTFALDVEIVPK